MCPLPSKWFSNSLSVKLRNKSRIALASTAALLTPRLRSFNLSSIVNVPIPIMVYLLLIWTWPSLPNATALALLRAQSLATVVWLTRSCFSKCSPNVPCLPWLSNANASPWRTIISPNFAIVLKLMTLKFTETSQLPRNHASVILYPASSHATAVWPSNKRRKARSFGAWVTLATPPASAWTSLLTLLKLANCNAAASTSSIGT